MPESDEKVPQPSQPPVEALAESTELDDLIDPEAGRIR